MWTFWITFILGEKCVFLGFLKYNVKLGAENDTTKMQTVIKPPNYYGIYIFWSPIISKCF